MAQQQQTIPTNKTIRLPLVGSATNRDSSSSRDQRYINMFPESKKVDQLDNTKLYLNKRPGLTLYKNFGTGEGRSLFFFKSKFYAIVGNTVYVDGSPPTSIGTLSSSTGPVSVTFGNSSTIGDYVFICDGTVGKVIKADGSFNAIDPTKIKNIVITAGGSGFTNGSYSASFSGGGGGSGAAATYTVTGNAVTSITISNFGTGYTVAPTISFPSGGGTGATATVFLNAFPTPHIVSSTFIDGYTIIAKGSDVYNCDLDDPFNWSSDNFLSAEMFPDPVVALSRQNNQVVVFGENSIEFFFDAANASGSPLSRNDSTTIQMGTAAPYAIDGTEKYVSYISHSDSVGRAYWIIDGFQPKKVSDEYIERILDAEPDMTTARSFATRVKGHFFYVLNLKTQQRTLVYDPDEKLWHEWSTYGSSHTNFAYDNISDNGSGIGYLLHVSNGNVYKLDVTKYQDDTNPIQIEVVTSRFDMDTSLRKFMSSLKIVGDRDTGNLLDVYWSDDDYQSWSNAKTIDLGDDFPAFQRLGSFRRRSFRLKHNGNKPLRLESLECVFSQGSS